MPAKKVAKKKITGKVGKIYFIGAGKKKRYLTVLEGGRTKFVGQASLSKKVKDDATKYPSKKKAATKKANCGQVAQRAGDKARRKCHKAHSLPSLKEGREHLGKKPGDLRVSQDVLKVLRDSAMTKAAYFKSIDSLAAYVKKEKKKTLNMARLKEWSA